MKPRLRTIATLTALVLAACHAVLAGEILQGSAETFRPPKKHDTPLGHPDFYPSHDRPIGWRGDWTGAWPGDDCVTYWNAETSENIAWKANTPGAGFSQPIVVGEKVFITCEPNLLVCYSVHTGEELWRAAIDYTTKMTPEVAERARAETGVSTRFAQSPVLYKDYFVVNHDNHLRVYKKQTGEKVWEGNKHGVWGTGDTSVYNDGFWYTCKDGGEKGAKNATVRMSVASGEWKSFTMLRQGGNPSVIMVGRRLYDFGEANLYKTKGGRAFNFRREADGVGSAGYVDLAANKFVAIKKSHIDRRIAGDDEWAYRYAYVRPGHQGGNASPCAQANRIFHRTKGVLTCIGDPGDPFPVPKDCPSAARAPTPPFAAPIEKIVKLSKVENLAPYLEHAHPAVRATAARRLIANGKANASEALQRLAAQDLSATVRAAAILALGAGPTEPGGQILAKQIADAGAAGPWQHAKPPLQRVIHTLRVLGDAADPVILSTLKGKAGKARDVALACVLWREVGQNDAVRDLLLSLLSDRKGAGTAAQALANWPGDSAVTARFTKILKDPKQSAVHVAAFSYLLPLQKPEARKAFLESIITESSRGARTEAVAVMVADGDLERVRPLMAAATGTARGEIAYALSQSCAGHPEPDLVKTAFAMIHDSLKQADPASLAAMVGVIGRFYADAEPALPTLKAIDPGDDARLKQAIDKTVKVIEMKVREARKKK